MSIVTLLAMPALAACGPRPPRPARSSSAPSTSPSPTADPKVADATAKAIAAYDGYVKAYANAATTANPDDPNLAKYIGGPLLSLSQHNLRVLKDHGAVELGSPKATVSSSRADLAASPPTVTVESCMDYSDYRLVYQANQSPVPNSSLKLKRYTSTATVSLFADGRWLASGDTPHRDTSC